MSPLKISSIVAALAVLVTAGGLYFRNGARQREAQTLRWENDRLRQEASMRVSAATAVAPSETAAVARPASVTDAAEPAPRAADYYRNEGNATPQATLQTFAWACDRGDVEIVARLLFIEPAARPKAEAFWASLPSEARAQWKNVDEMAAAVLARSVMERPFPHRDLLATATVEPIAPDRVRLTMPNVPVARGVTEYQQFADGWKYVLTAQVVDAYIQQSRRQ